MMRGMDRPVLVHLRKRWAEQAFWDYAKLPDVRVPVPLQFLVAKDRVLVSEESARRVLDYFRSLGFRDDETPNLRTPVEVVDFDGNPVGLSPLAAVA